MSSNQCATRQTRDSPGSCSAMTAPFRRCRSSTVRTHFIIFRADSHRPGRASRLPPDPKRWPRPRPFRQPGTGLAVDCCACLAQITTPPPNPPLQAGRFSRTAWQGHSGPGLGPSQPGARAGSNFLRRNGPPRSARRNSSPGTWPGWRGGFQLSWS
jgi:hypothetical protein